MPETNSSEQTPSAGTQTAAEQTPPAETQEQSLMTPPPAEQQSQQQTTQAQEQKPSEQEGNLLKPEEEKPQGAPESYGDFKLPEGFTLEGYNLDGVKDLFKESNLTQEQAQKLIDMHCDILQKQAAAQREQVMTQIKTWKHDIKSHKDFDVELSYATQAMKRFVKTPEERALFDDPVFSNHPAVWSLLVGIGKALTEDHIGRGGGSASTSARMYNIDMNTLN